MLPLPVVLISTVSKAGIRNIAPWSCVMPILRPLDEILIASWIKRDTLTNIRETGDFVINVPPAKMADAVVVCSKNYPHDVDEFEKAGLEPCPSKQVKSPGITGCLARMECTLKEEIIREKYSLIIGKVVHLEVEEKYFGTGEMDFENAQPLSIISSNTGMRFTRPTYAGKHADLSEMILRKT